MNTTSITSTMQRYIRVLSIAGSDSGGGAGLGLYIVDQICNRMGWKLAIFSQEKVGTEVRVEFYSNAE